MASDPDLHIEFGDCASCPEGMPEGECPKSLRPCGHHCNHSWDQDHCHWCGVEFGEDGAETTGLVMVGGPTAEGGTDGK